MKELKKKILELFKNGLKAKEISEKINVEYAIVRNIVKLEQDRIRRAKDPQKFRDSANRRYPRYAEKTIARSAKRYEEKKDEILEGYKEDRQKNPQKWFEIRKKYRERKPRHVKDLRNTNYAKHAERNRPRVNKRANELNHKNKEIVYTHYSKELSNSDIPNCNCCGYTGIEFLTVDHIIPKKGDGKRSKND